MRRPLRPTAWMCSAPRYARPGDWCAPGRDGRTSPCRSLDLSAARRPSAPGTSDRVSYPPGPRRGCRRQGPDRRRASPAPWHGTHLARTIGAICLAKSTVHRRSGATAATPASDFRASGTRLEESAPGLVAADASLGLVIARPDPAAAPQGDALLVKELELDRRAGRHGDLERSIRLQGHLGKDPPCRELRNQPGWRRSVSCPVQGAGTASMTRRVFADPAAQPGTILEFGAGKRSYNKISPAGLRRKPRLTDRPDDVRACTALARRSWYPGSSNTSSTMPGCRIQSIKTEEADPTCGPPRHQDPAIRQGGRRGKQSIPRPA